MRKEELLQLVIKELKEFNLNPEINLEVSTVRERKFEDLMLDSLETLELALSLEEILHIELEISEFPQDATVGEFVDYLVALKN